MATYGLISDCQCMLLTFTAWRWC